MHGKITNVCRHGVVEVTGHLIIYIGIGHLVKHACVH